MKTNISSSEYVFFYCCTKSTKNTSNYHLFPTKDMKTYPSLVVENYCPRRPAPGPYPEAFSWSSGGSGRSRWSPSARLLSQTSQNTLLFQVISARCCSGEPTISDNKGYDLVYPLAWDKEMDRRYPLYIVDGRCHRFLTLICTSDYIESFVFY